MLQKDYLIDKNEKFQCVSNPTHLLTPISRAYTFNAKCTKMVRNTLKSCIKFYKIFEVCLTILGGHFPSENADELLECV